MTKSKGKGLWMVWLLLVIGFGVIILFSATVGSANLTILDSFKIIIDRIPLLGRLINLDLDPKYITIVMNIRLPRIILGGLVGMALAAIGCSFQGIFRNPMADPYVLGVSSGAAFGATVGIVLNQFMGGGVQFLTQIMAFLGAFVTIYVVYQLSRRGNKIPVVTLLLAGIAVSYLLQSCISIMMIFNRDQLDKIVYWTMGSVSSASWKQIYFVAPLVIAGILFIFSYHKDLNVMLLGEEHAMGLGIDTDKVKKLLILVSSCLVAVIVSVSGIIGFVGLIVPHAVRLFVGPNHKVLIPFSVVSGGIFLVLCDTLARTLVSPTELPVGAVTAVFGAPYFLFLLYRNKMREM